ncbi:hypothetical protein IFM46972_07244 [Aspergillus udagawae]|uniref:Uncharacterized protein n=1 Tax=Aspergillus udagawae TaxID=91492 RepID=A0A8H3P0D5_9EURO|nr:hypothetical protein IFM46972_07244 [Aspergillus udagawae]
MKRRHLQHSHSQISFDNRASQLTGPDIVSNFADELQLVDHAIPVNRVTLTVTGKTTLRADADLLEGLFNANVVALGDELGSFVDALLHLLLVLELGELAGYNAQDDVLVARQLLQRLEATGTGGVVLEVVGVDVELLEQLGSDAVIATLGEVTATNKVTATDVNTDVEIGRTLGQQFVVLLDVLFKCLVGSGGVQKIGLPALQHLLRAEVWCLGYQRHAISRVLTSEVGVIELDVSAASIIQDLQFLLVGFGDITQVLVLGAVYILGESLAVLVTKVVPVGSSKGELHIFDLLGGHQASQVLELVDICAANVPDLAVFSIRKSGIAQLLLGLDNIFDIPVLDSLELGRRSLSLFERYLDFQELLSPEERAKVLGAEGRVTVKLSHGEYTESY